jgi:hypothetical protein
MEQEFTSFKFYLTIGIIVFITSCNLQNDTNIIEEQVEDTYSPPSYPLVILDYEYFYGRENNDNDNHRVWTIYETRVRGIWFSYEIYRFIGNNISNFSKKERLQVEAVQAIFQDNKGRLWIGGGNGLYRYDGRFFLNITKTSPREGC